MLGFNVSSRPFLLLAIGSASIFILTRRTTLPKYLSKWLRKTDTIHGKDIRISRIIVYPIKSCAGIDLTISSYDHEGFEFDRKWMVVDVEKNKQLSARDNRGIKLVRVFPIIKRDPSSPDGGILEVTFPDSPSTPSFSIPLCPSPATLRTWDKYSNFILWGHASEGYITESASPDAYDSPSDILSEYLGRRVLLVMNTPAPRPLEPEIPLDTSRLAYDGGSTVRYPDVSPFLLCSTASIADAEAKVWATARGDIKVDVEGCAVPEDAAAPDTATWAAGAKRLLVERFRPNIIVSGVEEPFGEDDWQEITVMDASDSKYRGSLLLPARCPRCMFPNVDTEDGKRDPQMPNNAMMQYRKVDSLAPTKYCFGMYTVPVEASGVLSIGDTVFVRRSAVNPKLTSSD